MTYLEKCHDIGKDRTRIAFHDGVGSLLGVSEKRIKQRFYTGPLAADDFDELLGFRFGLDLFYLGKHEFARSDEACEGVFDFVCDCRREFADRSQFCLQLETFFALSCCSEV